jgi:hypothetical protein
LTEPYSAYIYQTSEDELYDMQAEKPRDPAKPARTQMDEDEKEPRLTVVDFTRTIDCDVFAEVTFMAAFCTMISLVFWIGAFSS